jgi:8-oxo-dGTP diphosphatase
METSSARIGVNTFVFKDGKLLMGKRLGKVGSGTWCLPGGHFEFGEHLSEAAARELEEETSIKATELEFIQLLNQPREDVHYVHINFLVKSWTGEPKLMEPDKFSEWSWFDLDNHPEPIFEGHVQYIPAFKEKVNFID